VALQTTWFILISVVWTGFFVLEGFDFGVGMLVPLIGRTDDERRTVRSSIGPFWDGNEVWLIVAAGRRSRRSPTGTPRCSPPTTCRCCSCSPR
jgi:cytochrome d ubiquinol oxidase subunit II